MEVVADALEFVGARPVPGKNVGNLEQLDARQDTIRRVTSAQLNRLWGAVCAFAGIFLFMWALSWLKASVLNEDLQNRCEVQTAGFPFEKSCTHEDGTVEGANSLLFDGIFFGSMTAAAISLTAVLTIEARRRK